MPSEPGTIRIAAIADLHYPRTPLGAVQALIADIAGKADVLCICGDLTDTGLPDDGRVLARELSSLKVPTIAVLGNHDWELGRQEELTHALIDGGIHVLDGTAYEVHGIGFAGVKGFAGGFGRRTLGPWGERAIKDFVQEALNEALKLETALARIRSEHRIVLMHYAPIAGTVEGEPLEIYPFLGSSRLEEPLGRYAVDVVFHGHAHHGAAEGRTAGGTPVYNVSMALLQRAWPDRMPYRLQHIRAATAGGDAAAPGSAAGGNPLPAGDADLGHRA